MKVTNMWHEQMHMEIKSQKDPKKKEEMKKQMEKSIKKEEEIKKENEKLNNQKNDEDLIRCSTVSGKSSDLDQWKQCKLNLIKKLKKLCDGKTMLEVSIQTGQKA